MMDHHIIPYSRLRDVWNTLLDNNETRTIKAFIALFAPDDEFARACERFVTGTGAGDNTITTSSGGLGRHLNSPMSAEVIASELFWAPWNLVEGPALRTDDPRDGTDCFSFQNLPDAYRRNRLAVKQQMLEELSRRMKRYLAVTRQGDGHDGAALGSLRQALEEAHGVSGMGRVDFNQTGAMWEARTVGQATDYRNASRTRRNSVTATQPDPSRLRTGASAWTAVG